MDQSFFDQQIEETINQILSGENSIESPTHQLMNLFSTIFRPNTLQIDTSIVHPAPQDVPYATPTPTSPRTPLTPHTPHTPRTPVNEIESLRGSLQQSIQEIVELEQNVMAFASSVTTNVLQHIIPSFTGSSRPETRRRRIDPYRRFSSYEYHQARCEFRELCETDEARNASPPTRLLNILLDYYFDNDEEWPTQEEILEEVRSLPCGCIFLNILEEDREEHVQSCFQLSYYSTDDIEDMLYYYLFSEARIPSCQEIFPMLEYYSLQNRFPSREELQAYALNRLAFYLNPEEYHQQDREHVPVAHPERIPVATHYGDPIGCGICQEDITNGQSKIVLQRCNHSFHAHAEECLETASIFNWFRTESKCPMCKISINETM